MLFRANVRADDREFGYLTELPRNVMIPSWPKAILFGHADRGART
jgi:hypothetical protein